MLNIEKLLKDECPIYAHIGRDNPETLKQHSDLVMHFCQQLQEQNGLDEAVTRTIQSLTFNEELLTEEEQTIIKKWFYDAIYLHDIGKINPAFQKIKMKQEHLELDGDMTSKHSLFSSLLYLHVHQDDLQAFEDDAEKCGFLTYVLLVFSYLISRHHTYLKNFSLDDYKVELQILNTKFSNKPLFLQFYANNSEYYHEFTLEEWTSESFLEQEGHKHYPFYILNRLLYSTLVASDFYATYTYDKKGKKPNFRYLSKEDVAILRKTYNETKVIKGIEAYKVNPNFFEKTPINKLRSDMYIEAEKEIIRHQDESIFYLEAPTGGGKTNMSINLALTLLEKQKGLNKILYIFPFNTLVEQTKKDLDNIFPEQLQNKYPIKVVNSVTPIVQKKEKKDTEEYVDVSEKTGSTFYDYKEEVLYRQMIQYPVTVTSHVNFFNYLFGVGRESNLAFTHLCNSVIIIDEIQSYKNARWMEIIEFFTQFAKLMNLKIIIMSATLPKLDRLLHEKQRVVELLPNAQKYFHNPLFKNRVSFHYELLDKENITLEQLAEEIVSYREQNGPKRILIECISVKDSEELFGRLEELIDQSIPLIRLNGSHHAYYRKKVINQLGKNNDGSFKLEDCIVVATQVIEAGVDIDMDVGFKDISVLDSEEQFAGRINRSCLRKGDVFFFNMAEAKNIYRGDFRLPFSILDKQYRHYFENKQFDAYYQHVFDSIKDFKGQLNENHIESFYKQVHQLQYEEVAQHMKLIEQEKYQVFLAYDMVLDDGCVISGTNVWQQFVDLTLDRQMDFSERKVKLSLLSEKMDYFLFSTYIKPAIQDQCDEKIIGEIYYIENGDHFLERDPFMDMLVFNEKKLNAVGDELLL
ncbi:CRISPR-associated helicase/endonuclease Cas3 [Massilibacterium senegalense]|uniref:CRISPR-associated helicase/endonuclease Cas3 n=1 Tax=Massilibacterium senegalense TaxID=1632858 RepID=UPI0007841073|nr:CRISPR-associated helicase/endonuclease Cas3 [Massilibacterium senegalense]